MPALPRSFLLAAVSLIATAATGHCQGPPRLLGWNDLGMHCTDNDYSVFSILPPFNTIHAQLVVGGQLIHSGSYTVSYEAVADPNGSINTSSIGKTEFWTYAQALFGATLPLDVGLMGFRMPGAANVPQPMVFDAGLSDWVAEGVPIVPIDDNGVVNPYPLMRLVARSPQGSVLASSDIVLPVSAEVACAGCHASGANPAARPSDGWVYGPAATDDRLNILRLHDRHLGEALYASSLQGAGYSANGLYDSVTQQQTPVLCANCHGSVALGAPGQPGVSTMTSAMHTLHGQARLANGRLLEDVTTRASCYTCHPGARTRCLRGAMGKAIGADGEPMMSCQDCHGNMAQVGDPARIGWLDEPNCQACHSGDALQNEGQIRFANAFDTPGHLRVPSNQRFATTPDAPQAPFSLYRFSTGHGELECSACHGSTHAIWPTTEDNDNLQSIATQGHVGTVNECSACHSNLEDDEWQGPHGMHPTGASWVDDHGDIADNGGAAQCRSCHGTDYRGTALSRSHDDRVLATQFGVKNFWRGYEVGCYDCHDGPDDDDNNSNVAPVVLDRGEATPTDVPLQLVLSGTDANNDALTYRIVDQPQHGAVAFDGSNAVYRARDGYVGPDSFTYAATDGSSNSNLGTVQVTVGPRDCAGTIERYGYGCPLASGDLPQFDITGCAEANGVITFTGSQLPMTSFAIFAMGSGRGGFELDAGCALRLNTIDGTSDVFAVQNGAFSVSLTLPASLAAWTANFQALCLAPAEPRGFVLTNGVEIVVP